MAGNIGGSLIISVNDTPILEGDLILKTRDQEQNLNILE